MSGSRRRQPRRPARGVALLAVLGLVASAAVARAATVGVELRDPEGEPVEGARLALTPPSAPWQEAARFLAGGEPPPPVATAVSDAAGRAALPAPPGLWWLDASAPGRRPARAVVAMVGDDVELRPLELAREVEVEVRVVDDAGRPLSGALVSAVAGAEDWLRAGLPASGGWQRRWTDAAGRAVVGRAAGEALALAAVAPGFAPVRVSAFVGERPTLRLAPGVAVAVEVRDRQGRPVAGTVVAEAVSGLLLGSTAADGRLEVQRPAREALRLAARAPAGAATGRAEPPRRLRQDAAEGQPPVALVLEPPGPLVGRVIAELGRRPVAAALVWVDGQPERAAVADARGVFSLAGVAASGPGTASDRTLVMAAAPGHAAGRQRRAEEGETVVSLPATSAVAGRVIDAAGRGVEGAVVVAREAATPGGGRGEGQRARAGGGGAFRLAGLEPEALHRLGVDEPGYAPARVEVVAPPAGGERRGVEVVLSRGSRVFGTALGADGQPLGGARATLAPVREGPRSSPVGNFWQPEPEVSAATDDEGRFALAHLAPGRYDLTIGAADHAPLRVPGLEVPAAPDDADLGTFELAAGAELIGRVVEERGGDAIAGATVEVIGGQERGGAAGGEEGVKSGPDGRFVLDRLTPGEALDLLVRSRGFAPWPLYRVPVPGEGPLLVALVRAAVVEGRVVDDAGAPVVGARVSVEAADANSPARRFAGFAGARSDEDGRFAVEDVIAGTFTVKAEAAGFLPGLLPELEVGPGERRSGLRLVLERGATVGGRVLGPEGEPVTGALVHAVPEGGGRRGALAAARSDGAGRYRLIGVAGGEVLVNAEHPEYLPARQEIAVPPAGELAVDLHLERGLEVAGRVVGDGGEPVAGVLVSLEAARFGPGSGFAASGPDGGFTLRAVPAGTWRLQAEKEGYALADPERRVEVAGPVAGLEVRLLATATITGAIHGLDPADLARLQVMAMPDGDRSRILVGGIDPGGTYRVGGASPGSWRVVATLGEGEGAATGTVEVGPGQREARLDLELTGDLRLAGRVALGGVPLAGAHVEAVGRDVVAGGYGRTDEAGWFELRRLAAGLYELSVTGANGGILHRRTVELVADLELAIDVDAFDVRGRVVDAATGAPVGGAAVALQPWAMEGFVRVVEARSGEADGTFRLREVAPGRYSLRVGKDGYAVASVELAVGAAPAAAVEVALEPSAGGEIEVRDVLGGVPRWVSVTALDDGGAAAAEGLTLAIVRTVYGDSLATGEGGRVRLTGLPAGRWRVLVTAAGLAVAAVDLAAPGPPVPVTLAPEAVLDVAVPSIVAVEGGEVRLLDPSGRPLLVPEWSATARAAWPLRFGRARIAQVPAGTWRVVATGPDGAVREATVTAVAGAVTAVVLE